MNAACPDFPTMELDHIGILVADISKAAETYVSRYGCRVESAILHDSVQTAFVQFLSTGSQGARIELVTPDGPQSKLSNALKKGGGLNHLCYLTSDIEIDCARLRQTGMFVLHNPVPAVAFDGRRIAWLMGKDGLPIELVERNAKG
jgi:methylmalonyl-CoA/ethylmalonyl-CoA epimerase